MSGFNDSFADDIVIDEVDQRDDHGYDSSVPVVRSQASDVGALARIAREAGPRDMVTMAEGAREIGRRLGRAAFYNFPIGGKPVEGGTIDLAYALMPLWGRCVARVTVESQQGNAIVLRGQAIDLLNVTAVERDYTFTIAPPPGRFAGKADQVERWNTMQVQSAASKAVRGAIFGMIPSWVVDAAIVSAQKQASDALLTRKDENGRPYQLTLEQAIEQAIAAWQKGGIHAADLEAVLGKPREVWTIAELDELRTMYRAIQQGADTVQGFKLRASTERAAKAKAGARQPTPATMPGLGASADLAQRVAASEPQEAAAGGEE